MWGSRLTLGGGGGGGLVRRGLGMMAGGQNHLTPASVRVRVHPPGQLSATLCIVINIITTLVVVTLQRFEISTNIFKILDIHILQFRFLKSCNLDKCILSFTKTL